MQYNAYICGYLAWLNHKSIKSVTKKGIFIRRCIIWGDQPLRLPQWHRQQRLLRQWQQWQRPKWLVFRWEMGKIWQQIPGFQDVPSLLEVPFGYLMLFVAMNLVDRKIASTLWKCLLGCAGSCFQGSSTQAAWNNKHKKVLRWVKDQTETDGEVPHKYRC